MGETIEVWVVTGFGCKPCANVKQRLHRLEAEFPELKVSEFDVRSDQGTAVALRYRLVGLPGVLINGRMVLVGDVSESLLRERLEQTRSALLSKA